MAFSTAAVGLGDWPFRSSRGWGVPQLASSMRRPDAMKIASTGPMRIVWPLEELPLVKIC